MAEKWAKQNNNMPYFETSAKEGTNVEEAFKCIAKIVKPVNDIEVEMGTSIYPSKLYKNDNTCC